MSDSFALFLPEEPVPVRLMNTVWADRKGVHDALLSPSDLREWLSAVGAAAADGHRVNDDDLAAFRTLREALRRLAAYLTEDTRAAAESAIRDVGQAVHDVNSAVTRATTWPQLALGDGRLRRLSTGTATPAMRSLSAIAGEAIDLLTDDEAQLRACYAPGCVLYFVRDHPRREWCSTACGNRARAARHYRRHRT